MHLSTYQLKPLSIALLLAITTACSSGGGSGTGDNDEKSATKVSGLFLDAEVEGLSYTTDSGITGQTDENGTYEYIPGEQVSFSVGGVNLGTVDGAPVCTPFDFGAASRNIARFIQSLDADNDPTNGIDIVDANAALAGTTVDSDAFIGDDATFAANTDIQDALTITEDTLIDPDEAQANLDAGTDSTFENADVEDKLFVVIVPDDNEIGIISFDTIDSGAEVFSIVSGETADAGGDGSGVDETWAIDSNGVLTLTDPIEGSVNIVNRTGGSSRSISVNFSEDGAPISPATLLFPQTLSASDLGGDGATIAEKTYDIIDADGTPISITFFSNGTFSDNTNEQSGTFSDDDTENVVRIINNSFPEEVTFIILMDGDLTEIGNKSNILIVGATLSDPEVSSSEPDVFINIGVGSATLVEVLSPE